MTLELRLKDVNTKTGKQVHFYSMQALMDLCRWWTIRRFKTFSTKTTSDHQMFKKGSFIVHSLHKNQRLVSQARGRDWKKRFLG